MSTIIDHSEHMALLVVAPAENLIIEKDDGSPKHDQHVHVSAHSISLGLLSTVTLQDHGVLSLSGLANANLLGKIDIGDSGKLNLSGTLAAGVLSQIDFTGHDAKSVLTIDTSNYNLLGSVGGFGAHDEIHLKNLTANSAEFMPNNAGTGGELLLFQGNAEVGEIGLAGQFTNSNFALTPITYQNGGTGTSISFVSVHESQVGPAMTDHTAWANFGHA